MVWTLPLKHKLRDYEELEEIDVFNEKSLKAHLKFITLVAKLSKAGMGSFPLIFFPWHPKLITCILFGVNI